MTTCGTGAAQMPVQAQILRNLIEGADLVMSHILHFYHLAASDYINFDSTPISGQSPWYPKDNTDDMVGSAGGLATTLVLQYVAALDVRRRAHEMGALMDGKHPCTPALIPGGVTKTVPSAATLVSAMSALLGSATPAVSDTTSINGFIQNVYVPTVVTVAKAFSADLLVGTAARGRGQGCSKYLAYGTFPTTANVPFISGGFLNATAGTVAGWTISPFDQANIREYIGFSKYDAGTLGTYDGLHPSAGVTKPNATKSGAYSWLKAPRYVSSGTHVCEVGPLARVLVNAVAGVQPWASAATTFITGTLGLPFSTGLLGLRSVIGRHGARALECQIVSAEMNTWLGQLADSSMTGNPTYRHRNIPRSSTGYGLTEAPRGALGHWISVDGKKITNYQCCVPTTWNCGPKSTDGQLGPVEQAINGATVIDDATGRTRIGRIVRSFDPCIACAVHIVSPDKKTVSKFEIVPER